MKLAIVRQKYTPFGGAERFVERALAPLRARGVQVEVIARHWQGELAARRCDPFYLGRTWRDWSFARCVQRLIAAGVYDLVQAHERIPGCHIFRAGDGVHATWLELSGKSGTSPWHRYTLAAERTMFQHANLRAVICNSRLVADDIARRYPALAGRLHVIYNGVDGALFHPRLRAEHRAAMGVKATTPLLLYVGSGFARKGVATAIEALAGMRNQMAELWIVGHDKAQTDYQKIVARLGLGARVRFWGAQTDVRPFYGAADLFVLPSRYDPCPNAALEALACGLAVITTTTCGAAELLDPPHNGAIVPPGDAAQLAAACDALLALPGQARRQAARAAVAALSMEAMAARLSALYDQLLTPR